MPPLKDLTGHKFYRLTVVAQSGKSKEGVVTWLCRCECGALTTVRGSSLRNGNTKSCGCYKNELAAAQCASRATHGAAKGGKGVKRIFRKSYVTWKCMKARCYCETDDHYKNYGARGIHVCKRWHNYANFVADMGEPPSSRHTLDRIDNNGQYGPQNCRWATPNEQHRNTRFNRLLTFQNKTKCVAAWSDATGLSYSTIYHRIRTLGWSVADALTKPARQCNRIIIE